MLLDVGDTILSPREEIPIAPGALNKATTFFQAHGLMGMEAMAPGEAELALGIPRLSQLAQQAGIALLAANLVDARGQGVLASRRLVSTGGVRVGLIGVLELPETAARPVRWRGPAGRAVDPDAAARGRGAASPGRELLARTGLRLTDAASAARVQVSALRAEGAELVVLLAHVGMPRARELARVVPGVELILVGHSGDRTTMPERVGGALLMEAGRRGHDLGHVEIRLGEGWTPGQELVDDSLRHVTYQEGQADLERIRQVLSRGQRRGAELPERARLELERARTLAGRLRQMNPPRARHSVIGHLIALDARVPDHPAVSGLVAASRSSWR